MIIKYKPNGVASCGIITAHGVPTSPIFEYMRNSGTVITVEGIDMNARVTASRALRPGNRMVAMAYPAKVAMMVAPTPATTAYMIVLNSQRV